MPDEERSDALRSAMVIDSRKGLKEAERVPAGKLGELFSEHAAQLPETMALSVEIAAGIPDGDTIPPTKASGGTGCPTRTWFSVSSGCFGRQIQEVKILIVLATCLMLPIVMKFQTATLLTTQGPRMVSEVEEVLRAHQVLEPSVEIEFLDAKIGGLVESESKAESIADEIEGLPGVRLVSNRLRVLGWLEMKRAKESWTLAGLVSPQWAEEALQGFSQLDRGKLRERETVRLGGKSAAQWGIFLDRFFQGEADRSLLLSNGKLTLAGEVTPSERGKLFEMAQALVPANQLEVSFSLRPSHYHYSSRSIDSNLEGEQLRSLSRTLSDSLLGFFSASAELSPEGEAKLKELARLLQTVGPEVTFVLGGHPDERGSLLAGERARAVRSRLIELGVPSLLLKLQTFEMTEDGSGWQGKVELIVR